MPAKAESLPSEIWLDIFQYLEGHDLIQAFSRLNLFFTSLLCSSHLRLNIRIKQNESNRRLPMSPWSKIRLSQISSLAAGQRKANCLIQFLRWNAASLLGLRSLSVYLRKSKLDENIQLLTIALQQIPSLVNLRIKYGGKFCTNFDYFEPLMMYIFNKRSPIQNCSFDFNVQHDKMKTSKWTNNPSLKSFRSNQTSWTDLFTLLSFTPCLCFLQAEIRPSILKPDVEIVLLQLTKAKLILNSPRFVQLEAFKAIAPNLTCLDLVGSFNFRDKNYFNETLWLHFLHNIKSYRVNLSVFVWGSSHIRTVNNYIQDLREKQWCAASDHRINLHVSIQFTSSSILQ
ncbi:unnamed protein product [Adineta ricciae]|uniref:F-box domain-containing protein n=2 Tax=Adineta ricciae TaxID=249248 RepID=A0A814PDJ8_ADIRI|nr:unnamed protein product [Adineta ricciae]